VCQNLRVMSDTPDDPRLPGNPAPGGQPFPPNDPDDVDDYDDDDESAYELTGGKGRFGGRGRILAIAVGVLAVAGIGAALLLPGGGDDDDPGTGSDDGGGEDEFADAAFEYAQCMRDQGIDMPDPVIDENGGVGIGMDAEGANAPTPEEMQAAEEECGPIMEQAEQAGPDLTPEEVAERQDQALAMSQCMRDRGWNFPDPEVDENGGIGIQIDPSNGLPGPEDADFEQFEQDQEECNEESGLGNPEEGEGGGGVLSGGGGE